MSGSHNSSPKGDDEASPLIHGQLISEDELMKKVTKEAITPWSLSDFEEVEQEKEALKKQSIMQEVEKQIQPELQKRSEVLKKEVYDLAYQEGYEAGFKVGQEEGEATGKSQAYSEMREFLFPKIDSATRMLQSLKMPQKEMKKALFDELIQFSLFIAEQLLGEQLLQNPDWLFKVVQESIQTLPESEGAIEVFLNPEDLDFLKEIQPDWVKQWVLVADEKILPGSCTVKRDCSSVHNSWQERFLALKEQLANNARLVNNENDSSQSQEESLESLPWENEMKSDLEPTAQTFGGDNGSEMPFADSQEVSSSLSRESSSVKEASEFSDQSKDENE